MHSMTGFAEIQEDTALGLIKWEVRSLNHRFLEAHFHLPEMFKSVEAPARTFLNQVCQRGKIDCYLYFEPRSNPKHKPKLNESLLTELLALDSQILRQNPQARPLSVYELLSWPSVLETNAQALPKQEQVLALFEKLLQDLSHSRAQEGASLAKILDERTQQMRQHLVLISQIMPKIIKTQQHRIRERMQPFDSTNNREHIEQIMTTWLSKGDIAEECDRLAIHLTSFKEQLDKAGPSGRRLDFLLQEMQREVNTLNAKSLDASINAQGIELKVLIEQLREQIQNIE